MQGWVVVIIALAYVTMLFGIASFGDKRGAAGMSGRSRPYIYALSLAIYCTSWTFFGSVGLASERGLEFLSIYIGPIIVFVFGFPLLKHIVRLAKTEKLTSIADFLGARYGKNFGVASIATLIATVGAVPYISLQLKAISGSVGLMIEHYTGSPPSFDPFIGDISLVVAVLLALFAILFGTRHADATEHQDGLVLAVAVESVVKITAFLALGVLVTFFLFGDVAQLVSAVRPNEAVQAAIGYETSASNWIVRIGLSACAILLLPRQFYMTVVENRGERELRTATWLFPLYLVAINIFVLPIALAGLVLVGDRTSADLYVLSLPLFSGHDFLAVVAFVGGLSAATAMVIVESVALSIMISNDLVIPLFVRRLLSTRTSNDGDWSALILNIRRAAIFIILFAAFFYYRQRTDDARLAAIGLMSFAAIAQLAPSFFGGLMWRGANARGAAIGMAAGIVVWAYTLLLPSLAAHDNAIVVNGLFGLEALRPQALFGSVAEPLNHGVLWSLAINTLFFVLGSLSRASLPQERIQAAIFAPRDASPLPGLRRFRTEVTVNELKDTISRYLGVERTERSFQTFEAREGRVLNGGETADMSVLRFSEQLLASVVGSSSARLILSLLFQRKDSSSSEAYRLLDDATEALQHNRDLLQVALDQMGKGLTVFDRDLRLTCWNRQYRNLFDLPDELGQVGVSARDIFGFLAERGDIATNTVKMINRLSSFEQPWQIALAASGRIIEIQSNPMPDGGVVATYADITASVEADLALKRANETLEQRVRDRTVELTHVNQELAQAQRLADEANLSKTRFLAAAGHDILQPLNAARLYSSSLIEKAGKGEIADAVGNIDSSLDSVEAIIGAVLDISRLDAGAMVPNETVFGLDGLLRRIGNDFQPMASRKGLRLDIVPSSIVVHTDRNLLRRLIQNLVSNAIKYTPRGRILLGVRRRGELAEIQVIDTGIGIPQDKRSIVFREFTRLEQSALETQGLGLGLSIVDRLARVLGMEIGIDSIEGKGTCFSVTLPATGAVEPAPVVNDNPAVQASMALSGLRVLCIDNDARILDGMRLLLSGWGCTVTTFPGSIATDMGSAPKPDVALVDYHLDRENGLDAIGTLRGRYGRNLPAILITADRTNEVRAAASAMDVSVIGKPVKPAVLRSMLTRLRRMSSAAAE